MAEWIDNKKLILSIKVDRESMLGKINEMEKMHEQLGRMISDIKREIQIEEEPTKK